MSRFMLLHYGFEKPTDEIMAKWKAWFESVADVTVENAGFMGGREISHGGTAELAWDGEAITGYTILEADSLDEAERLASENPFIKAIRVYEIRPHG